jgi:hypothetical protein
MPPGELQRSVEIAASAAAISPMPTIASWLSFGYLAKGFGAWACCDAGF